MTDHQTAAVEQWHREFAREPHLPKLESALAEVIASEPENVSPRVAALGLAAGRVVATVLGEPDPALPAAITAWVHANASLVNDLVIEARVAAERVHAGAEVAALGTTPDHDVANCRDAAADLMRRLG